MSRSIIIQDLRAGYDNQEILHGVSAEMTEGGIYALFGPNGSGKSTLLKCLSGLLKYTQGEISILGQAQKKLNSRELSRLLAYVPQEHQLSFPYSVQEVVLMGRTPHLGGFQGPSAEDKKAAEAAMEVMGLSPIASRSYTQLSGGQRQLVMIARAYAQDTPVVILDEPTSALDFKNQMNVWRLLQTLKAEGKTVIVCTHDPNHVLWFCDQALVLKQGELIRFGRVGELMQTPLLRELYGDICEIDRGCIRPVRIN